MLESPPYSLYIFFDQATFRIYIVESKQIWMFIFNYFFDLEPLFLTNVNHLSLNKSEMFQKWLPIIV